MPLSLPPCLLQEVDAAQPDWGQGRGSLTAHNNYLLEEAVGYSLEILEALE